MRFEPVTVNTKHILTKKHNIIIIINVIIIIIINNETVHAIIKHSIDTFLMETMTSSFVLDPHTIISIEETFPQDVLAPASDLLENLE